MKGIHIDELISKTINFMSMSELDNLDRKENSRDPKSVWGRLSLFVFNVSFDYNLASRLRMAWIADSEGFQTIVLKKIKNTYSCSITLNQSNENHANKAIEDYYFFIKLDLFQFFLTTPGSRRLSAHFTRYISNKLQKKDICCWLTCINNSVSIHPFYSGFGKFKCISKKCNKIFSIKFFKIPEERNVKIIVSFDSFSTHKKISEPALRITGLHRKELGLRLLAYGTTNIRNEHVISNAKRGTFEFL